MNKNALVVSVETLYTRITTKLINFAQVDVSIPLVSMVTFMEICGTDPILPISIIGVTDKD